MNSVDPNYTNPQSYLRTWVPTHSIGKNRIHPIAIAEVITAIALIIFMSFSSPGLGFLLAGVAIPFYTRNRNSICYRNQKEIYLVWDGYSKGLTPRDFQIFIHPQTVASKLARANSNAQTFECERTKKNFAYKLYPIRSEWTAAAPKTCFLDRLAHEFQITSFKVDTACVAQAQGRRDHMEDIALGSSLNAKMGGEIYEMQMLAVLDGHNGVPNLTLGHLLCTLKACLEEHNSLKYTDTATFNALKLTAVKLHGMMDTRVGSTLVLALQIGKRLWIVNSGDSRAFIVMQDGSTKSLTVDAHVHSKNGILDMNFVGPSLVRGAILNCSNLYTANGSSLAMLRSLGDHRFPGKTARPKITYHDLSGNENFLVMVSDGIPDVGRNDEIGAFINKLDKENNNLQAIAAKTVEMALVRGSKDNLTCLVKSFKSDINISNENE